MEGYLALCDEYLKDIIEETSTSPYYGDFTRVIGGADNTVTAHRRYAAKNIDISWIDTIEAALPSLDTAIRNPRKFIKTEEEILPVELTRKITPESIKHLAMHTNLISKVEGDRVFPTHLLNQFKEESYETYENRFIYTLLNRLYIFIQKRYDALSKASDDEDAALLRMESKIDFPDGEKITYRFEIESEKKGEAMQLGNSNRSPMERLDKLRTIICDYYITSSFAQAMKPIPMVRPPIMRTNAIMKDNNLKACLVLWQFVESYDKVGYNIESRDGAIEVSQKCVNDMYHIAALGYGVFKKYCSPYTEEKLEKGYTTTTLAPKMVTMMLEELADRYDFDSVEIQKVFTAEVGRVSAKKAVRDKGILDAIDAALAIEREKEEAAAAAVREKEREERERERIAKYAEAENARLAANKERAKKRLIEKFEKANAGKKSSMREKAMKKLEEKLRKMDEEDQ